MKYVVAMIAIFVLLVWIPVESAFYSWCFNNYDLGIYAQAIHEFSLNNLNPWLSGRYIHLFNDHFEPIFFLLLPFKNLFPEGILAIRVEMLAIIVASMAPVWLARRQVISNWLGIASSALILLSPITLDAAYYPAHPGTWSLAPLAWMFSFLLVDKNKWATAMFVLALFCKEEYPVMGGALGAILFMIGRKQIGAVFFGLSVLWGVGVFVVRPLVLGPSSFHTNTVSHFEGLEYFQNTEGLKVLGLRAMQLTIPLLPLFILQGRSFNIKKIAIPLCCFIVFFLIRVAGGYWGNHRVAPLGVASVFILIYWLNDQNISISRLKIFALLLLVFAFADLEWGTRIWRGKPFRKHCPSDSSRLTSLSHAATYLRTHLGGPLLTEGNLVPPLVDLPNIAQIGITQDKRFEFFLVEKGPNRNPWPLSSDQFNQLESVWRNGPDREIIQDDDHVLLIRLKQF